MNEDMAVLSYCARCNKRTPETENEGLEIIIVRCEVCQFVKNRRILLR